MTLKVGVVGLGNWGTALANHLSHRGHEVVGWTRDEVEAQVISKEHLHPVFHAGVSLHSALKASTDLSVLTDRDLLVIALPSKVLVSVLPRLKVGSKSILVSAVKGFAWPDFITPLQYFARQFGAEQPTAVLSGPSFAADVVRGKPCGLVAASTHAEVSRKVAECFSGGGVRVYLSDDPIGVELGGIVKNVIALAVGASDALNLGDSARASLIARGAAEMTRLVTAYGGKAQTVAGLSGIGDLGMTATSTQSRNRTVGYRLGLGERLEDVVRTLGSVAEGVVTAPAVLELAKAKGVEMPICECAQKVLTGEMTVEGAIQFLLQRPVKPE